MHVISKHPWLLNLLIIKEKGGDTMKNASILRKLFCPAATIFIIFAISSSAWAATYYADTGKGNDSNPGTISSPWRTIQKAANTMVAGDTVTLTAGTYNERVTATTSGTAANNMITYQVSPGDTVRIKGFVLSGNWIKIDGFEITDTASDWNGAVHITGSHCIVTNCNMHDLGRQCVKVEGGKYTTISNNTMTRCNVNAVSLESGSDYTTVDNNDISDSLPNLFNDANGIFFFPSSHHTISRNYIHNFSFHGKTPHIDAFQISDSGNVTYCTFERNHVDMLFWQNVDEYGKAFELGGLRYSTIKNNIFRVHLGLGAWGDAGTNSDLTIVNNTFIGDKNPPCSVGSNCWPRALALNNVANSVIKNNISVDFPYKHFDLYGNTPNTVSIDYNCFWNSDGRNISSYTQKTHDLWGIDPKLVNLAGGDYRGNADSPCRDAGDNISGVNEDYYGTPRPQGNGVDIGAHEIGDSRIMPPTGLRVVQ